MELRNLKIPEKYIRTITKLLELEESAFERLMSVVADESHFQILENGFLSPVELRAIVGEDAPGVADTIDSFYAVRLSEEVSADDFAEDICEAVQMAGNGERLVSGSNRGALKERLKKLLDVEPLALRYKARDLQTEDEHTFCDARVLTDLRPVFGSKVSEEPRGVVMVHLLKLGYHDTTDDQHRSFYVTLDAADLASLKKVIERAETKAETLRGSLERAGIRRFGI